MTTSFGCVRLWSQFHHIELLCSKGVRAARRCKGPCLPKGTSNRSCGRRWKANAAAHCSTISQLLWRCGQIEWLSCWIPTATVRVETVDFSPGRGRRPASVRPNGEKQGANRTSEPGYSGTKKNNHRIIFFGEHSQEEHICQRELDAGLHYTYLPWSISIQIYGVSHISPN